MNKTKMEIIQCIQQGGELPEGEIVEYRKELPDDTDGAVLMGAVYMRRGEYSQAFEGWYPRKSWQTPLLA